MNSELEYLINKRIEIKYNLDDGHIFIVGAFTPTIEKEILLVKCIKKLKEFNIPILLVSHLPISIEITKLVDYYIFDSKNELLTLNRYPEFNLNNLRWIQTDKYFIKNYVKFHHDYAALTLIKNGVILSKTLGKKKIHYFDYDCIIDTYQYSQTFLIDIDNYDVVFGFLFSMKIELAEEIFVNNVTTLENHFSQINWRFEDFLINNIKKYTNSYKVSDYIDNDKTINTEAAWLRAGINRNGEYFELYLCVNSDNLYLCLFSTSNNCTTPTSGLIYNNTTTSKNILLEIKYHNFNKFINLIPGNYDLINLGKYIINEKVEIKHMGIKVFDEVLNIESIDYEKISSVEFTEFKKKLI